VKVRLAGIAVVLGAIALGGTLWMDWYAIPLDTERALPLDPRLVVGGLDLGFTAWEAFAARDVVLAVCASVAGLGGLTVALAGSTAAAGLAVARVAGLLGLLVVVAALFSSPLERYGMVDGAAASPQTGACLALGAVLAIVAAAWLGRQLGVARHRPKLGEADRAPVVEAGSRAFPPSPGSGQASPRRASGFA
jgi:hypothetical protein